MESSTWSMLARAHVPVGLPKAPRMPVCSRSAPAQEDVVGVRPDAEVEGVPAPAGPGTAAAVVDECRSVGFFKATKHGVPARLADALEADAMAYFALQGQDKMGEAMATGGSSMVGRAMEEVRSALNEHADVGAELFGRVSTELRSGFGPVVDTVL